MVCACTVPSISRTRHAHHDHWNRATGHWCLTRTFSQLKSDSCPALRPSAGGPPRHPRQVPSLKVKGSTHIHTMEAVISLELLLRVGCCKATATSCAEIAMQDLVRDMPVCTTAFGRGFSIASGFLPIVVFARLPAILLVGEQTAKCH